MCLTESQAGRSLSNIVTKATPVAGEYDKMSGQKIVISVGDRQYAGNFVRLVLARIEGASEVAKGTFLFIVPKNRLKEDGALVYNDVITIVDFQKMGQRGHCTAHLGFGDKGDCRGWLVGEKPKGLNQMILMMNRAK
jgi:butyryl-CoA dehydrogenase